MSSLLGCADMEGNNLTEGTLMEIILYDFRIIDSEEIGLMIQAFDDDGDGEIDYNEFLVIFVIFYKCAYLKLKLMVCRRILREKATEVDINLEKPAKPDRKSYFASRFFT